MRIDQVMELTPGDIETWLDQMDVRQSATGKLHLFPDPDRCDDPRDIKVTFCGLTEDRLQPPDAYQRPASTWSESALVPPCPPL